jgi:hypothetical protein
MDAMTPSSWVHCGREFSARGGCRHLRDGGVAAGIGAQELAATLCEHLGWVTLTGTAKIGACLEFLQRLQAAGLLVLPAQRAARAIAVRRTLPGAAPHRCRADGRRASGARHAVGPRPRSAWK